MKFAEVGSSTRFRDIHVGHMAVLGTACDVLLGLYIDDFDRSLVYDLLFMVPKILMNPPLSDVSSDTQNRELHKAFFVAGKCEKHDLRRNCFAYR